MSEQNSRLLTVSSFSTTTFEGSAAKLERGIEEGK
jgi:hypothetical protein